jgi:hypothetical protein
MLSKKSFCIAERKFSELYPFADGFKEALLADAPEIIVHGRRPDLHHVMAERLKETRPCWARPSADDPLTTGGAVIALAPLVMDIPSVVEM